MSSSKSPTLNHRIEYLVYRGFEAILKRISPETTFKAGEVIGRIVYRFHQSRRKSVLRNLRRAFGEEKSAAQLEELAADVFERNGANFLSSMRVPFLSDEELLQHVRFEGLEKFQKAADEGGIILVLPHMGNWELCAQVIFLMNNRIKIGTHYRPLNNSLINEIVKRRRRKRGLVLFAKKDPPLRLTNFVRQGGVLGILADQRVGSRGAPGVFFGRPTTCSPLPHLIAKRGKGQLISIHCETEAPAQWVIYFDKITDQSAQGCATSLEKAWRQSPSDVFWFEDRWRIQGAPPLEFLSKYDLENSVTRPLRMACLGTKAPDLILPPDLINIEYHEVDFGQNDRDLRTTLAEISRDGQVPVDAFCVPAEHQKRLKGLSDRTLTISA